MTFSILREVAGSNPVTPVGLHVWGLYFVCWGTKNPVDFTWFIQEFANFYAHATKRRQNAMFVC